jgi:hypothetical protein
MHTRVVCVWDCVYIYIDMIFREKIVPAVNIFSVPKGGCFKINFEFHMLLLESGLDGGNCIRLFLKI